MRGRNIGSEKKIRHVVVGAAEAQWQNLLSPSSHETRVPAPLSSPNIN
jgi:hypothetical protein